jgi:putative transposase
MARGIEKRKIFINDEDRRDFIARLASLGEDRSLKIYAWALLPNHFHLLCKTGQRPLSGSMRRMLTGYAVNFNKRHQRHGHLFQNRYRSIVCQEDNYLTELVRYIHLNLLRANQVRDLDGLNRSPWSGHSALMGKIKREWQDVGYVLSYFGKGLTGRKNYLRFVEEGIASGRKPEMVGGGLIRSLGGWSNVLALRSRGSTQSWDQRILGDGDFVEAVLSQMDEAGKENLRFMYPQRDLSSLASEVCGLRGVVLTELKSGSRRQEIVKARRELSQIAVKLFGYSGAEVARFLGVTNSCVTREVSLKEIPQELIERYGNKRY